MISVGSIESVNSFWGGLDLRFGSLFGGSSSDKSSFIEDVKESSLIFFLFRLLRWLLLVGGSIWGVD